jgi:hypothetical protein
MVSEKNLLPCNRVLQAIFTLSSKKPFFGKPQNGNSTSASHMPVSFYSFKLFKLAKTCIYVEFLTDDKGDYRERDVDGCRICWPHHIWRASAFPM